MNEITVKPLEQLSDMQIQAQQLHTRIMTNGQLAVSAMVEFCKGLKQMRDEKLYVQLGYESFDSYAEQAVGIKQRQAYSYISTYEKLGSTVLQSNATLGITKLELLTQINPVERAEFIETHNLEAMSTRELKETVAKLNEAQEQISILETTNAELEVKVQDAAASAADVADYEKQLAQLEAKLSCQVSAQPDTSAIEKEVQKAVRAAEKKSKQELEALKKENASAVKAAEAKVLEQANKKIDQVMADKQKTEKELADALKQAKINHADPELIEINFIFKDLQSTANNLVQLINQYGSKDSAKADQLKKVMTDTLNKMWDL